MLKAILVLLGLVAASQASHFYVTNNATGHACIIVDADFKFTLNFFDTPTNSTKTYTTSMQDIIYFDGDCNAVRQNQSVQHLNVTFFPVGMTARYPKEWVLSLVFGTSSNEAFKLIDYTLSTQRTMDIPYFGTFEMDAQAVDPLTASGVNGYKCSTTNLGLVGGSKIELKGIQAIAFANINGTELPKETVYEVCYLDARTSDVVPIVVGACLAALVIVVLVAYLIGRARAKRQGYASV